MFSLIKFGGYLSRLRKNADMTQSELAEKLNVTRQAISCYEVGDSFPDVSILIEIANIFHISLDQLIHAGNPTKEESVILNHIANKKITKIKKIDDIINLAPHLKPSIISKLSKNLSKQGLDISSVVRLAEYLNDQEVISLLENTDFEQLDEGLIERLIPILDETSKNIIFQKILDGQINWQMIRVLLPNAEYMTSLIEAAVIEGVLPKDALLVQREAMQLIFEKENRKEW